MVRHRKAKCPICHKRKCKCYVTDRRGHKIVVYGGKGSYGIGDIERRRLRRFKH